MIFIVFALESYEDAMHEYDIISNSTPPSFLKGLKRTIESFTALKELIIVFDLENMIPPSSKHSFQIEYADSLIQFYDTVPKMLQQPGIFVHPISEHPQGDALLELLSFEMRSCRWYTAGTHAHGCQKLDDNKSMSEIHEEAEE